MAVIIPFAGLDPWRTRAHETVLHYYATEFPNWRILSPTIRFTHGTANGCAHARNTALTLKEHVIIFNDADSLVPAEQLTDAADQARNEPGLVFAWDNYQRLSQRTTARITPSGYLDAFTAPVEWEMYGSLSAGCMAISGEAFRETHGFATIWRDGYEDIDFALRCGKRWPNRRVPGDLTHLWHPRPTVEPENGRDRERFNRLWGTHAVR